MVFGLGKKKKPPEPPPRRTIRLRDVSGAVSEIESLRGRTLAEEAARLRERAAPAVEGLAEVGRLLKDDDLDVDEADRNIRVIVVRGKKQVIEAIGRCSDGLPEVSGEDGARELEAQMAQILKRVGDALGRQKRVIHLFAKKYSQRLRDDMAEVSAAHKELRVLVTEADLRRDSAARIREIVAGVAEAEEGGADLLKKAGEAERDAAAHRGEEESLRAKVEEERGSDGYARYLAARDKSGAHEAAGSALRAEAASVFARISRPLGRYSYGSSLDKEKKALLESLASDPYDALRRGSDADVAEILGNVRRAVSSGSISVKDVQKSLAQVDEAGAAAPGLAARISAHEEAGRAIEAEVESARPLGLERAEKALERAGSMARMAAERSESLRAEAAALEGGIPGMVSEAGRLLCAMSSTEYVVERG
ncbi:MAG: hypothetical protein MPJ08_00035 [Nitrosopumilus sp.]|nr:hypothetical protein [Nitrosopumilus sp.]